MEVNLVSNGNKLFGLLEGTQSLKNDTIAILMHGFRGDLGYTDAKILFRVSNALNKLGIPTIRFDFGGCGRSEGNFSEMTVFSEIQDGINIINFVKNRIRAKKIYLIGHSQGGVVASMLAAYFHDVIDKVVLMAPAATLKDDALKGECQGSHYDPMKIPDSVEVGGYTVGGGYFRTAQLLPIYETAQHYDGKVLLIHGLDDQVVSPEASRKYNVILPNSELHLLEGVDHAFSAPQGDQSLSIIKKFLLS